MAVEQDNKVRKIHWQLP